MKSGIVARNAGLAEHHHRLRDVEVDHLNRAVERGCCHFRERRPRFGQRPEQIVEDRTQFLGGDVAHHGNLQPVPHQGRFMRRLHIREGEGRHRLGRAVHRARVRVPLESPGIERLAGERVGIGLLRAQIGHHLRLNPREGRRVEARFGQRGGEERQALVAEFGEHLGGHRHVVARRREPEPRRHCLAGLGETGGVKIAGPLFEERRHQADRALAALGVEHRSALKARLDGQHRDRMLLVEPGGDAAGRDDFGDLDFGPRRECRENRQRARRHE